MKKLLTLVLVKNNDKILLGMKKRGFGVGKWNGFGGKVEQGEDIETAAKRELTEECGLTTNYLNKRGIITCEFEGDPMLMEIHIFSTDSFLGTIVESEEMMPRWYNVTEIPYQDMWADDKFWIPLLLKGEQFKGYFKLAENQEEIIESNLEVVSQLP